LSKGKAMQRRAISFGFLTAVALALFASPARAEIIERVVATVNDDMILLSELRDRAAPYLPQTLYGTGLEQEKKKRIKELYGRLLDQLVDELLVQNEARKAHITVTKLEIDQAIDNVREQNLMSEEDFRQAIRAQGMTELKYREDIRKQLVYMKLTNQMVRSRVNVTEEDKRERYEEGVRKARRTLRFRAAHVFFELSPNASAAEVAETRRRAAALRGRLDPKSFEAAMREQGGGDLGWLSQGDLPEELERTLLSLEPGQISEPVRGPSGLHIFLLQERQRSSATLPSYEQSRESIERQMLEEAMGRQQKLFLEQLRRRAVIDIRL
jgi:peptidyl-prolyl cis-trans isomerase SurA